MLQINPLAVDITQEDNVLQILANPPLLSSQHLEWEGINVQYHDQPALETPNYYYKQHMLLVHNSGRAVQAERVLAGRKQREQLGNGNVVIVPANVQHQVNWDRKNNFTLLFLEPAHLARVAYESVNVERVELVPQFAMRDPLIYQIGLSLKTEIESDGLGSRLFVDSLTNALAVHLLRHYTVWQQTLPEYTGGLPLHKLQQAIDYINDYLAQDLSLEAIANAVDMSQYYFARLFKQSMGIAPYQYLLQQRVERAKQLLVTTSLSIAQIAHQVGFSNQSQLTLQFRKFTGTTPLNYRRQL